MPSEIHSVIYNGGLPMETENGGLTGAPVSPATGVTGSDGRFITTFTAPTIQQTQDVTIRADVGKPGYDSASGTTAITVRVIPQRLTVMVERVSAVLDAGKTTGVTVTVTDLSGAPVPGANVTLRLDPAGVGGELASTTGTTALNGTFSTTLTATVGADTTFRITAIATASGYTSSSASTSVLAKMRGGSPPPASAPPGPHPPPLGDPRARAR